MSFYAGFYIGACLGILAGILGSGFFALLLWLRLRNKNAGGKNNV